MKHLSKPRVLSGICAAAGILCLGLRLWLLRTGQDAKGLLDPGHPGDILSWLLTAAVGAVLLLSGRHRTRCRFVPSRSRALGLVLSALGFGAAAWVLLGDAGFRLSLLTGLFALAGGICCLIMLADLCRKKKSQPLIFCPSVIFYMLFLVCSYQFFSGEPELQRCVFPLLAVVLLLVSAYRRAAIALDRRDRKLYLQLSRGAVFLSLAAIPGSRYGLALGLWALGLLLDGFAEARPRPEAQSDSEAGGAAL